LALGRWGYFWGMLLTLLLDPNLGLIYRAVAAHAAIGLPLWVVVVWGGIWMVRRWRQGENRKALVALLVVALVVVGGLNYLLAVLYFLLFLFS
jgi:hypothetical protein